MVCTNELNVLNLRPFKINRTCKVLIFKGLKKALEKIPKKIGLSIFY